MLELGLGHRWYNVVRKELMSLNPVIPRLPSQCVLLSPVPEALLRGATPTYVVMKLSHPETNLSLMKLRTKSVSLLVPRHRATPLGLLLLLQLTPLEVHRLNLPTSVIMLGLALTEPVTHRLLQACLFTLLARQGMLIRRYPVSLITPLHEGNVQFGPCFIRLYSDTDPRA